MGQTQAALDEMVKVEHRVVQPTVTADVELFTESGTRRMYGLGFLADERVLVLFKGQAYAVADPPHLSTDLPTEG